MSDRPPASEHLLACCVIVRDASDTIDALLDSIRGAFDEYVFVDTGSADDTRAKIEVWASMLPPKGVVRFSPRAGDLAVQEPVVHEAAGVRVVLARFAWVKDFAAARNYSFSLATAKWRTHLDADDVLPGAGRIRPALERLEKRQPACNCVVWKYDYAPTIVQDVARLVRWDDGWRWEGAIHEHLVRQGGMRVMSVWEDAIVRHTRHAPARDEAAVVRNTEIARAAREAAIKDGDRQKQGLDAYFIGQAARHAGDHDEAEAMLSEASKLLEGTNIASLACVELALSRAIRCDGRGAAEAAGRAISHDPTLREGYGALGLALGIAGDEAKASAAFDMFFAAKGPTLHTSADAQLLEGVFPAHAAVSYLAGGRIKDAREALAQVAPIAAGTPGTAEAVAQARHGLARHDAIRSLEAAPADVTIFAPGGQAGGWDPDSLHEGHLGGSEEAVVHLSAAFARRGLRVVVHAPPPSRDEPILEREGVLWLRPEDYDPAKVRGTVLAWRCPGLPAPPSARMFHWLHDAHYGVPPEAYRAAAGVIVLSSAHAKAIRERDGYDGPFLYGANGIDPREFPPPDEQERDPHACVYASSPNRGLDHLLDLWPRVREAVPDATLSICYDWSAFDACYPEWSHRLRNRMQVLCGDGVRFLGGLSHDDLNALCRASGVWSYPATFLETYCTTSLKMAACGCWPVTTRVGALPEVTPIGDLIDGIRFPGGEPPREAVLFEECGWGMPDEGARAALREARADFEERYFAALVNRLRNPPSRLARAGLRQSALAHSWDAVAEQFMEITRSRP